VVAAAGAASRADGAGRGSATDPPCSGAASRADDRAFAAGLKAAAAEDWDSAIEHFEAALAASPGAPAVMCNLGLAHAGAGHELAADAWLRAYLAAAPFAPNAGEVRKRIDRLEDAVEGEAEKILDQAISGADKIVQLYGPDGGYYPRASGGHPGYHPPVTFVNGQPFGGVPGSLSYGADLFSVLKAVARSGNIENAVRLCEIWRPTRRQGEPASQSLAELWVESGCSKAEAGQFDEAGAAFIHPVGDGKRPAWLESDSVLTAVEIPFRSAVELGDWRVAESYLKFYRETGYSVGNHEGELSNARDSSSAAIENDPRTVRQDLVDEWIKLATEFSEDEATLDLAAALRKACKPPVAMADLPPQLAGLVDEHITAGLNRIHRLARKAELLARNLCAAAKEEIRLKDYLKPLVACACAVALAPEDAHPYYCRAEAEMGLGDRAGAMADLSKAIEISPEEAGLYSARAWLNEERGNYDGAVADWRKALEVALAGNYYRELFRNHLARVELKQGAYDAVVADCDEAIALHSADKARMEPAGSWNEDAFEKEDDFYRLFVGAYRLRSDARFARGDWAGAMADRQAVSGLFQASGIARSVGREADDHFALAAAQAARGDDEAAIAEYDQAAAGIDDLANEGDRSGFAILHRHVLLEKLGRADDGFAETVAAWSDGGAQALPGYAWMRTVGLYLVGRLDENALFARAAAGESAEETEQRRRMCTACYFAGMSHLLAHDTAAARTNFKKCAAVGQRHFPEYQLGARELAQLPPPTWGERLMGAFGK
jgi:tetratricopeptide (TPR) repeat protein